MTMAIVDATDHVLGRLCSVVAKRLLKGEEIILVNAEKAIITGKRSAILSEFKRKRTIGSQRKGPYYPKRADRIVKRSVRGMLPYQRPRGREALRRLQVHIGVPRELEGQSFERLDYARAVEAKSFLRIEEISKVLGAKL